MKQTHITRLLAATLLITLIPASNAENERLALMLTSEEGIMRRITEGAMTPDAIFWSKEGESEADAPTAMEESGKPFLRANGKIARAFKLPAGVKSVRITVTSRSHGSPIQGLLFLTQPSRYSRPAEIVSLGPAGYTLPAMSRIAGVQIEPTGEWKTESWKMKVEDWESQLAILLESPGRQMDIANLGVEFDPKD